MAHIIPAVFDAGVFRPLNPVDLAEGTQVQVQVQVPAASGDAQSEMPPNLLARQRAEIEDMIAEIERLPVQEPDDGFSSRDHDRVLYGKP